MYRGVLGETDDIDFIDNGTIKFRFKSKTLYIYIYKLKQHEQLHSSELTHEYFRRQIYYNSNLYNLFLYYFTRIKTTIWD